MRSLTIALIVLSTYATVQAGAMAGELPGIPPETVADYLHAVIESDRTFYTVHVVERLHKYGGAVATENWRTDKHTLPLPAQFLMEASELAAKAGAPFRYRLISLWPINPQNAPRSATEKSGLMSLQTHPEQTVTGTITEGDQRYFQAIYTDRAVSQSCVGCHNAHPQSPKRDFKLHDAMGALVIEIPIGR